MEGGKDDGEYGFLFLTCSSFNVQQLVTIHNNVQRIYIELCGEGNPDIEKNGVMVEDTGYFDRKKAWIDYVKGILFTIRGKV